MRIGVTIGDACGVGPEILLRSFVAGEIDDEIVVFGDTAALAFASEKLGLAVDLNTVASVEECRPGMLNVFDQGLLAAADISIGRISKAAGYAAVKHVERAVTEALAGRIDAITTLPINKEASRLSFPDFEGHTELIAGMCGVKDYTLTLISPALVVTHVSTHVSLREAIERTKTERILQVIRLTDATVRKLRPQARIAVAALNPHAGEGGAFGTEDRDQIAPAVQAARAEGIDAYGPEPSDTVFMRALAGGFEGIVCMYHDQGHIAMKLQSFENAVNVTIGLPIVRTSVDHGTAFDIAYQGVASTVNFTNALQMARKLAE